MRLETREEDAEREEEKKGSDDIDLIIGDTSALKRFESTSSSTEERKELGIRQIS